MSRALWAYSLMLASVAAVPFSAALAQAVPAQDPMAPLPDAAQPAPPVELPPAIASSKTYRCKDNSLVQIDWLANDKGAYVHGEGQSQTHLKPAEPVEGEAASNDLTAEGGFVLKGNATASTVTLTLPGKPAQNCRG